MCQWCVTIIYVLITLYKLQKISTTIVGCLQVTQMYSDIHVCGVLLVELKHLRPFGIQAMPFHHNSNSGKVGCGSAVSCADCVSHLSYVPVQCADCYYSYVYAVSIAQTMLCKGASC